ncbi:S1 family peptidase [Streptomyces klenkii]
MKREDRTRRGMKIKPVTAFTDLTVTVLLSVALTASPSEGASKIIGGSEASDETLKAAAAIFIPMEGGHSAFQCSGAAIRKRWVLTAAHCLRSTPLVIGVGSLSRSRGGRMFTPKKILQHPRYDAGTLLYDVGLIELDADSPVPPLRESENIATENMPVLPVLVPGWGLTRTNDGLTYPDTLRALRTRVTGPEACEGKSDFAEKIDLCLDAHQDTTLCRGDSGGPILSGTSPDYRVEGVVSRSDGSGEPCAKEVAIATSITHREISKWIKEQTGAGGATRNPNHFQRDH